ncbi:hypothetical protein ACIBI0_38445 [Microbispora rosea]|uniref:hypothetical protein n=1 Tax=Microbispora rosea TaxID=58117 RepID=UPI00378D33E1
MTGFIFNWYISHTREGRRLVGTPLPPLTGASGIHKYDIHSAEEAREFAQKWLDKDRNVVRVEFSYFENGQGRTGEVTRG